MCEQKVIIVEITDGLENVSPEQEGAPAPAGTLQPPADTSVQKGNVITDNQTKAVYKVTGTGNNKTVEYKNSSNKNAKKAVIPATVKKMGYPIK